jgi:hypothetical protein
MLHIKYSYYNEKTFSNQWYGDLNQSGNKKKKF